MRRRKPQKKSWSEIGIEVSWSLMALGGLVFFAWLNSTNFDATEIKMIGEYAVYWRILSQIKGAVQ